MTTPGRSYANSLTSSNNIHLIQNPNRFPQPIWKSYTDANPWTFSPPPSDTPNLNQHKDTPPPLPLPPDPAHPLWRRRCYNCLSLGHEQYECTHKERVCAKCWTTGHEAKMCTFVPASKIPSFDPLTPRGNLGDELMPENRPNLAMVFVPETIQMQQDKCEMQRAIVIDARLRDVHNLNILQSVLMATCATPFPFPITQINATQYLLLLPPGINRDVFLTAHATHLRDMGFVAFRWSPSVNGTPLEMKFKVWVNLKGMSPCSWTIEHLLRAAGSFGIVLQHAPLACVSSLANMRAVVAVPDLELVPKNTLICVRGIGHQVEVSVEAWIEEPVEMSIQPDPTPPPQFFEQVRGKFASLASGGPNMVKASDRLMVDFETLFAVWSSLDKGIEKEKD